MTRTVSRPAATLPSVALTPEQAAAIAVALAAQPDGPYAAHGRAALDKVLAALEPDPRRRGALRASSEVVRAEAGRSAALRSVVERGLAQRRVLVLHYRDADGLLSRRQVEPNCWPARLTGSTWWRGAGNGRPHAGSGGTASRPSS